MCKKFVLAALAIFVGTTIIRHTGFGSLVQVWWRDARHAIERQVPPEVQIKQLDVEVGKIDRDIKQNLTRLAAQEVDYQALDANIVALRESQANLRTDIEVMTKGLEDKTERITFKGRNYRIGNLTRKLDTTVATYEAMKSELKSKEKLLETKKQALEAAHARIGEMRDQKEKLRVTVGQLEARLQLARLNATRTNVDLDDSQVTRCKQLADEINKRLAMEETEQKLQSEYGYCVPLPKFEDVKPTADVLKAAKKALEEDETISSVAADKTHK